MTQLPTQIGPYEITREIGRGGMGVVYLARDDRLDRDVAIKALPEEMAADADRLLRFEREAKSLAALNHPNIAGIYGVEEQDGRKYLILEYVEGETLGERLDRGPIPVDEAIEIASGIEAAHEASVIHRDLKPDNIKITPEGKIKVLDFGLAKTEEVSTSTAQADSPTLTTPHSPTIPGAILGTAAYMSPEQGRGRKVDRRTDIWSFGVLLYEMLVGASPFAGETATDSIGAVLHKDPELGRLPSTAPPRVRLLVRRCLERDKARRVQAIGDVRVELEEAARAIESGEVFEDIGIGPRVGKSSRAWPVAVVGLGLAVFALAWMQFAGSAATVENGFVPTTESITSVSQITDSPGEEFSPALSPDGRTVVYSALDGTDLDLFALRVGGENPINLTPESDGDDSQPAFSPDGERVAYSSQSEGGGIFVMGATGESPRRVTDSGFSPAWSPDGTRLIYTDEFVLDAYSRGTSASLWIVDIESREVTAFDSGVTAGYSGNDARDAVNPSWSPDGNWIAFWATKSGQRDLYVSPAGGGERVALTDDVPTDWNPVWGPDSDRVYFMSDRLGHPNLWSIGFDPETGGRASGSEGEPVPLLVGPMQLMAASISADGHRIAMVKRDTRTTIERVGFDPAAEQLIGKPRTVYSTAWKIVQPSVSADGARIVFRTPPPSEDIVTLRGDGTGRRRLTNDTFKDRGPEWHPTDGSLMFYSNRGGQYQIWRMEADGTGLRVMASIEGRSLNSSFYAPDGARFSASTPAIGGSETVFYELGTDGEFTRRGEPVAGISSGRWSPDSTRLSTIQRIDGFEKYCLYEIATGEITPIRWLNGDVVEETGYGYMAWLDSERLINWDTTRKKFCISEISTDEARVIGDELDGAGWVFPVNGGTELVLFRELLDSDVWLIELGEQQEK